ncbi:amino acid ABC transporter substrate-binding protein, PAAT family [Fontibacillus panacisegetis]|uniref:Amino acid ABC transporter substrate-binding protein, PAAT family n=1 Tax=Fontibacillus panacisegetis TaxID=670482 RepID=A0A1G7K790_9BACL|nr:basic amino acid ABC transporter substrate-binding protein [Fontibacillus panacisegetis]SDF32854.1 amino acid ABC transporter substrate-binding protein, PAAT family [Fontibacillus panacisegetis]
MGKRMLTLLAVCLITVMAGCSSGSKETTYKIATDAAYAPMEYMDKDKITGFDVDFLEAVMKEAGLKYEIVNTGWDPMLTEVKSGETYAAGVSSISITDERKQSYDYSIPYFESTNMILVKEDSPIAGALDLKDKKVAVQLSTTADSLMAGIMGNDSPLLKRFDSNAIALLELDSGGVDAVVADIAIVREYMKNNPDKKFKGILDPEQFSAEYYGILFPKGSELKAKLDPAIKKVLENGTYTEVYKKWFGEEPNIDNVLNAK